MTVKELIEKLLTLDQDLPVLVYIDESETYGEVFTSNDVNVITDEKNLPYTKGSIDPVEEILPIVLIEGNYLC